MSLELHEKKKQDYLFEQKLNWNKGYELEYGNTFVIFSACR